MSHYGDGNFKENLYQDIMCSIRDAKADGVSNAEILTALLQIIADDVVPEMIEEDPT